MPLQRRLPKRGFKSMTRSRNYEVRLNELQALPTEEIDLLVLQVAGSSRLMRCRPRSSCRAKSHARWF